MNKLILTIIGILLIGSISALNINITAGETYQLELSEPYFYYLISENSSSVDLNITNEGNFVNIIFGKYMNSDYFMITFYNKENQVISSGGGNSHSHSSPRSSNKTITSLDNYSNPEDYPRFFQEIEEVKSVNDIVNTLENISSEDNYWWVYVLIIFTLIILIVYFIMKNERRNME